jgi:hypothetical protein
MRKFDSALKNSIYTLYRCVEPFADPLKMIKSIPAYAGFMRDWWRYAGSADAEEITFSNIYPQLHDKTATTPYDSQYFYQNLWAFKKILQSKVVEHVDVGSQITLIGYLTTVCKVTFIDIRPLVADLENFESREGSILAMPYESNSIGSLSCLHVAEHIGLGRYGDPLDPLGTKKACAELSRVLAKGGDLYFSLPVGSPRLCFNAHRIHSPHQVLEYYSGLRLVELSGITDQREFVRYIDIKVLEDSNYACGLFHFTKT